tara:strand:+ start:663 stop:1841 length:1179 start_codon:yes stop_codon:yes gene_type:complete
MKLFIKYLKHLLFILIVGYFIYTPLHYLEEINPLKKELSDFRFTDIYFGHFKEKKIDKDIVLVDIGFKDREKTRVEITDFLNRINDTIKPKVIAIDVDFKFDPNVSNEVNANLINALDNENIVMYYDLVKRNDLWLKNRSEIPINYSKISEGYTNCLVEKDTFGVLRFFQPYVVQDADTMRHLSLVISEKFGVKNNPSLKINKKAMINFSYDYNKPIDITDTTSLELLKDKIIIVGLFTKNDIGQPLYNDDLHYTSSNRNYLGKSFPNMYGGEVLATLVSNIKSGAEEETFIEYKNNRSLIINIILSFIIYYFLLYSKTYYPETYGTIEIIIKFVLVTFFILISILFVSRSNIYIDLTMVGIISFFAVEFVGPIDHVISIIENKIKNLKVVE